MKINVTKRDIDSGHPCHCYKCPIARAVKRITKAKGIRGDVAVLHSVITIGKKRYTMPDKARLFIKDFDACRIVKPFRFKIERYKTTV